MLCVPDLRAQASELVLHFGQKEDAQWCPDSGTCDFQNTGATESKMAAVCAEHSEGAIFACRAACGYWPIAVNFRPMDAF